MQVKWLDLTLQKKEEDEIGESITDRGINPSGGGDNSVTIDVVN